MITTSPLGEEELAPKVVERRGYLSIPWRDTTAEVWGTGDASAEPIWATAARATIGSESLSVIVFRDTATSTLRSMVRGA